MTDYFRAIPHTDVARPANARTLAGGWCWFTHVERLSRNSTPEILPVEAVSEQVLQPLTMPRISVAGLSMARPNLMGILNVTPDSFSDGGVHEGAEAALRHARRMVAAGADMIDVGGESTRPGAAFVPIEAEIARTAPAIAAITAETSVPVSIDTRKADVAQAAVSAGAALINDVSGFTFDAKLAPLAVAQGQPVCVMHAQGDPATMQQDPQYDDVLLDVYDFLETQVEHLIDLGISRKNIVVDPGIGFGKTLDHNLKLLARLSLFHSLGCPVLLGASRKRFIGTIGNAPLADQRAPGSIAVALAAAAQGVQIMRVHDVEETSQALKLWQAVTTGDANGA
ncbi:dihydropteroate synthase [Shimia sp. R10_1]|uniref:dihydropteroate synthase n=1 Tax=Shimia sp. R10_1 TaxID=2821095 RepID=UPI001ADD4384|nr:dihydropteroate synthase [Shimia sp. R10_1]MBO9474940.1 dihydropteroate synthase [Shimia sp. R10_1]